MHFYRWFLESFNSFILLLVALLGLIEILLHSCWFEGCCYDGLWCDNKGSWHRNISSIQKQQPDVWDCIFCSVKSGEAFAVKRNKHTHTHIQYANGLKTWVG